MTHGKSPGIAIPDIMSDEAASDFEIEIKDTIVLQAAVA
jgi:hypothetical protein